MDIEKLRQALAGRSSLMGREILYYDVVDSTNTEALRVASKGYPEGSVVIAGSQTGGKGRRGRTWLSPAGKNLCMSIILRPQIRLKEASFLTIMSSVACASALAKTTSLAVSIKWPNDLMVSDRKLGGILAETRAGGDGTIQAVIGIGINVNMALTELPQEIRTASSSIINVTGKSYSITEIASAVLLEMDRWYDLLLAAGKQPVLKAWRLFSSTLGRPVKVTMEKSVIDGAAEDVDEEGRLLLRTAEGGIKTICAGDVLHLRNSQDS